MAVSVPFYATWDDDALRRAQRDVDGFGQGILGSIGKLAGPLAAVGGAIAGAFAGAQLVGFAKDAIDSASGIGESLSKLNVLIPESASKFDTWSNTTAKSLGIAKTDALEAAGSFVGLFKAAGLTGDAGIDASKKFVQLAADMASFNNASPEETLQALNAGLRGEAEPLRRFNVLLDDATLRQIAFKKGIIASDKEALTPAQKTLAAYEAILEKTTDQQGDFARTADGAANKQRILAAQFTDAKTNIGNALLPAYETLLNLVSEKVVPAFERFGKWLTDNKEEISKFFDALIGAASGVLEKLVPVIEDLGNAFGDTIKPLLDDFIKGDYAAFFQTLGDVVIGQKTPLGQKFAELGNSLGADLAAGIARVLTTAEFWKVIGNALGQVIINGILGGPFGIFLRFAEKVFGIDNPFAGLGDQSFGSDLERFGQDYRRLLNPLDAPEAIVPGGLEGGVSITVNGALDPVAVANQINDLLYQQNARLGVAL
jgi:hypothetical protein